MTDDDIPDAEVTFEPRGRLGLITLNRPKALNALNREMCMAINAKLEAWAEDEMIGAVAIRGAGDRAFCAGGDVVGVVRAGQSGSDGWEEFFRHEYRLNHAIATYAKPYIALIDGIVMGGGVGLSIHAPYRVVTENVMFAMPETGIGLIPDVGTTYALPRLPGQIGTWLGLTGARLGAANCRYAEIATHHVRKGRIEALIERLAAGGPVDETLADFDSHPGDAALEGLRDGIDFHFAHDHVEAIVESLRSGDAWAKEQAATILRMSPTALKLTLRALRAGAGLDIAEALRQEYRVVAATKRAHDFYEGVRAQLIDKDRNPKWRPAALAEVDDALLAPYLAQPEEGDILFPLSPEVAMAYLNMQNPVTL